ESGRGEASGRRWTDAHRGVRPPARRPAVESARRAGPGPAPGGVANDRRRRDRAPARARVERADAHRDPRAVGAGFRQLRGPVAERRLLRGGDPLALGARELLLVPGLPHQRPGHVQARRGRDRPPAPHARRALERGGRSTRVEVIMRRTGGEPAVVSVPPERQPPAAVAGILSRYVDRDGGLQGDPAEAVPALVRDLDRHSAKVRISKEVVLWAASRARRAARAEERQKVEDELRSGSRSLAALKLPLYPYQIDGMLHLAFTERALLGDDMGLGKTAQAVAACALVREL